MGLEQAEELVVIVKVALEHARASLGDYPAYQWQKVLKFRTCARRHPPRALVDHLSSSAEQLREADRLAFTTRGVRYRVNRRRTQKPLSERWRLINRARSRTRACGEHAFRVIKQLWGFSKVRYRGLAKNLARAQTMFALANLYQLRRELLPAVLRCVP